MIKKQDKSAVFKQNLIKMILQNKFLAQLLLDLNRIEPLAYLSAGVIRNWVWSYLHGQKYDFNQTEIDVIFFDLDDFDQQRAMAMACLLKQNYPLQIWDITNQAFVHQWYETESGESIAALRSIEDALSYWPETATSIAVRIDQEQNIEVIAPFGLTDLFELKLRWNKRLVSRGVFQHRVKSKQFLERWPKLQLVNEPET